MKRFVFINFAVSIILFFSLILLVEVDTYVWYILMAYWSLSCSIFGYSLKQKSQSSSRLLVILSVTALVTFAVVGVVYFIESLLAISMNVKIWSTITVLLMGGIIVLYFAIKGNSEKRVTDKL